MHVVGHVVAVRHDRVEFQVVRRDLRLEAGVDDRRVVEGVGGQEAQVVADVLERRRLVLDDLMDVAVPGLRVGAAEFVEGDVLAGDVLDDVGTGDEHVALVAHRDHQVGLDRRIHRSASAFAEDDGDLAAPGRAAARGGGRARRTRPARSPRPGCGRPPESLMPMIGQPTMATHSISRATLRPNISPTEPWNTVWSWLKTPTGRR